MSGYRALFGIAGWLVFLTDVCAFQTWYNRRSIRAGWRTESEFGFFTARAGMSVN